MRGNGGWWLSQLMVMGFAACGGGGGGDSGVDGGPPVIATGEVAGVVELDEVGGEGLVVLSAWQEPAAVGDDGAFGTTVAAMGVQLLVVVDAAGDARALALSVPGEDLTVNATTTAAALAFLTPGLASADADLGRAALDRIRGSASFPPLVAALRAGMRVEPLRAIVPGADVAGALMAVVNALSPPMPASLRLSAEVAGFSLSSEGSRIEMTHGAWRYVKVQRVDLAEDGAELRVVPLADGVLDCGDRCVMPGAVPLSLGSIFTATVNSPSHRADDTAFPPGSATEVAQYWVAGPGYAARSVDLPALYDPDDLDAWGASVVLYVSMPLIDVLLGVASTGTAALEYAGLVWKRVKVDVSLARLRSASSGEAVAREAINAGVTVLSIGVAGGASSILVALGIVSAPAAAKLAAVLGAVSVLLGAANGLIAAQAWSGYPSVAFVSATADEVAVAATCRELCSVTFDVPSFSCNYLDVCQSRCQLDLRALDSTCLAEIAALWTCCSDSGDCAAEDTYCPLCEPQTAALLACEDALPAVCDPQPALDVWCDGYTGGAATAGYVCRTPAGPPGSTCWGYLAVGSGLSLHAYCC